MSFSAYNHPRFSRAHQVLGVRHRRHLHHRRPVRLHRYPIRRCRLVAAHQWRGHLRLRRLHRCDWSVPISYLHFSDTHRVHVILVFGECLLLRMNCFLSREASCEQTKRSFTVTRQAYLRSTDCMCVNEMLKCGQVNIIRVHRKKGSKRRK